ncbi:hypothetical protein EMIHUDRAFT_218945 [Emiliania huxleyi CCMP1516]|uniref:AP2/ERF domain-containing protein n=2 Tax=Emiliania huxleyi TaxID=2903 RepID=A0A0D3I6D6_EMIH1|nr:hypothetical protein EMIHUDRAFT_218945 [Emiliania huxleyi CCMP1516]EOD06821.1 hypothetical protein EMIHUDRAFT_218945 [Emiliania huxleyi CCMP1516]|eukprot:XP_005759250.1 hypothetical protein EMIHUDRAFT_218945 [Emiliania huxleyi CCMP1516]
MAPARARRDTASEGLAQNDGKSVHLGCFNTAEEAATAYARSENGRADAAKLLQPRAAPTAAGAEAVRQAEREGLTLTASSSNSTGYKGVVYYPKQQGSKQYKLQVWDGGKKQQQQRGYRGVVYYPKERGSKKYKLKVTIVAASSAHPEARLQPRDPNGWGATRCCTSLFHYRCLHTWLNEVETSRGMEPINTACPGCRGSVSKSASRMLS